MQSLLQATRPQIQEVISIMLTKHCPAVPFTKKTIRLRLRLGDWNTWLRLRKGHRYENRLKRKANTNCLPHKSYICYTSVHLNLNVLPTVGILGLILGSDQFISSVCCSLARNDTHWYTWTTHIFVCFYSQNVFTLLTRMDALMISWHSVNRSMSDCNSYNSQSCFG